MKTQQLDPDTEMLPEYNFSDKEGVRGKYYRAYQQGHAVRQLHEDGTVVTQYLTLEDGTVMLAPDVREYFSTSESVNQALRGHRLDSTKVTSPKASESR